MKGAFTVRKAEKGAFLMVNLGSSYPEGRKLAMQTMNDKIQADVLGCEVRHAFTSRTLIEKLAEYDGIQVDNERQALERLQNEGFTEVIVQPFYIAAGEEYEKVKDAIQDYSECNGFGKIMALSCVTVWAKDESSIAH
jgi:cobalamin biosynthesis Co2+ chelatase CbiK